MFKFWHDAAMLSLEAQHVVAMRMMKLARGGKRSRAEASRMVAEKVAESFGMASALLRGGTTHAAIKKVRRRVRRNSRRLSRR
jgi:ubiquinone biosynthesis protein UbiJ